jgi:hypothetical protein
MASYGQDTYDELDDAVLSTSAMSDEPKLSVQEPSAAMEGAPPLRAYTKDELVSELDRQLERLDSMDGGDTRVLESKLVEFYHSDLVKRIHEMRAGDPAFAAADDDDTSVPAEKKDAALWKHMKDSSFRFSARTAGSNPMAARWARALKADSGLASEYKRCRSLEAKDKFQARWAEKKYKNWLEASGMMESKEETKETAVQGQYVSIHRIAWLEGGSDVVVGMRAAMKYAARCTVLGRKWTRWCEFTESVKYLHITHTTSEKFQQSWKTWTKWTRVNENGGGAAAAGGSAGSTAEAAAGGDAGSAAAAGGDAGSAAAAKGAVAGGKVAGGKAAGGKAAGGKAAGGKAAGSKAAGGNAAWAGGVGESAGCAVEDDELPKKTPKQTPQWITDFKKASLGKPSRSSLTHSGKTV